MDSVNNEVVRESTIFATPSPRGYSKRGISSDARVTDSGAIPSGILPPVNPRDATSILRSPTQLKSTFSPKTPQSLMMAVPMTMNECWLVWKFLCDWVKTQLAMEVPASIPGFGTFYLRVQALGIRITLFEPDKQFLNKFCLQVDSEMPDPALVATLSSTVSNSDALASTESISRAPSVVGLGDVFAFSFVEMAACCGNAADSKRAQEWLSAIVNKLGNAMSQCGRVELNFGVGVILCVDGVVHRHLLSRDSHSSPQLKYEIRTGESVVKRNLRAQAALQTTPTPPAKYSFLSGSTFSSSIQLNPVFDRSMDVPDFSFGPSNPRRPTFPSVVTSSDSRASPRSTQLERLHRRSPSPRISRINTSMLEESDERNDAEAESTLTKLEGEDTRMVPQLFDRLCRTLCVEPDQNVSYLLPSNRIGSNFTPAAALLMTEKSASQYGQLTKHSGGVVFIEKPSFLSSSFRMRRKKLLQNSPPEQRYFEYLSDDKVIDRSYLAPLPADLEARVVAAAVKYIDGPSSDQIERVLEVAHQEFVYNYYASAKKAILNYLLMRSESCDRLGIPQGAPTHARLPIKWKWGSSDGPNGCMADLKYLVSRHRRQASAKQARTTNRFSQSESVNSKAARRKRVQSKLMSLLILSNPQVRALRHMWHGIYASITLVDLPGIEGHNDGIEPMDIIEFERAQLGFSAKAKEFVMENWYMKSKMMFESAIRAETFSIHTSEAAVSFRLRHLFDTVAAVMSLQIRSLIMKSIQAYVSFFERYGGVNEENYANSRDEERSAFPGLLTTLVLHGGQIQFRDPLVDIPSRLLNVLHNIPKQFSNLGRIETQFEEPIVLSTTSTPFLWNVAAQEDDIVVATIRIRAIIEQNLSHLRKLQADYDMFALTHRYVNSVDCFHLEENSELETYRAEMERVQTTALRLAIDNRHSQHLGLFSVDCRQVNKRLHTDLAQWTIRLLQAFEQRTGRINAELRQQYKEIAARLAKKPLDLYELVDGEAFVKSLKSAMLQELQDKANIIKQRLRYLLFERENIHIGNVEVDDVPTEHEGFSLSLDLLSSTAKTLKWRSQIEKLLKEAESVLVDERSRIESMFIAKRSRFQAEIEEFEGEVRGFAKKGDLRHAATYVIQLAKMQDNIFSFRQAMATIIQEEQKLQWKPTDFGKLDDIAEEMAPYERLWKTVREFREMNSRWLRGNIFELPGKEGMHTLQQMLTVVSDVSSMLILNSAAAAITAETVRKQMADFRETVRLIVAIQNPSMKERHMKAVSGLLGIDFMSEELITLLKLLENGAFERISDIVDISCNATQEQQIERALHEIRDEWETTSFKLVPSRHPISLSTVLAPLLKTDDPESETFNLVLEKECGGKIVSIMEDHLLRLQTLSCMSHAGPFIDEIALWQTFVSEMGQVVEMLTLVEHRWRKITPLFAAGIVENDSTSSRLFASAATLYQLSHAFILRKPACTEYYMRSNSTVGLDQALHSPARSLISDLEQCQEILDSLRGDVRVGFDSKRASFSRFYFLSDLELVTALALADVPSDASLWKALSRCFPGIHSVQTNAANEITALLSSVGEPFPLGSPIITKDTPMPTWLAKLETSMTTILHASIRAAYSDLPRKEFRKWCLIWPEQSLLAAIQHVWTLQSEQAYQNPNQRKAWTAVTDNLIQNIDAVSKEMRVTAYPHAKVALGNIILLLAQLRDVSTSALAEVGGTWVEERGESKCESCTYPHYSPSLCWIAQPRYYFIDSVLSVTMMTSLNLPYGLEYLGNGSAGMLVTPLTLRCFHAIAQAVSTMVKGACLEGAAGVGKTTICHQLARLCGRLDVTFQCANRELVFDELVNYIKATTSSGAWLCIDNFQLLDSVNVSLVTMLCAQVMSGLAARHAQCSLVGDRVRLRRGALFLLTLTTRSPKQGTPREKRLVQEARFFFRTVVVQSPDIEKLAEFEFQCARFVHASDLSKLLVAALGACERGFELMSHSSETTNAVNVLGSRLVNMRLVKSVVKRAMELNNLEKEHHRRGRCSLLISDEEHEDVSTTETPILNDATAEAMAKRDEERMEHRSVYLAIQECMGSVISAANFQLINSILRDFSSDALTGDLDTLNNEGQGNFGSPSLSTTGLVHNLENYVENYVRTNEEWKHFGVEFGMKMVQLLQVMRNSRAVVLSGEAQAGKTSLYVSLSRALTETYRRSATNRTSSRKMSVGNASEATLVAPTRCVVVCPRALRLGQLLSLDADDQSHGVLYKLLQEAKGFYKRDKRTQTWLVFDGNLDGLWSEQLFYTVEELQDDIPGYRKGLRLSSGKILVVPHHVRIIMESPTLTNASPSFLSRVGVVHVDGHYRSLDQVGVNVYAVWKILRRTEFEQYVQLIFGILDTLVSEFVPATLEFVETNFQNCDNSGQRVLRVQWTLALFHSSLKQSWKKFCSLTSDKQRNTAIHCLFLQALVWGVGSTMDDLERRKFHVFLYDLILHGPNNEQSSLKRLVMLFFPNGTLAESLLSNNDANKSNTGSKIANGGAISHKQTIYDYGFSVEFGSKWIPWIEYYTRWSQILLGSAPSGQSTAERGSEVGISCSLCSQLNRLVVPTPAISSTICLSGILLLGNHPTIITGPKDCGKTVCGSAWILLSAAIAQITANKPNASVSPEEEPKHVDATDSDQTATEESTSIEKIYAGYYIGASDVLLHLETALQRIRIDRQGDNKRDPNSFSDNPIIPDSKNTVYVFVDDLHCFDPNRRMDSAFELLRMLAEYQTVVDPATSLVTRCDNCLPFMTLQLPTPSTRRSPNRPDDVGRLTRRFIPIALLPFVDSDLTTICESISQSDSLPSQSPAASAVKGSNTASIRESEHVLSSIVKASLKLYRLLTSSNDFTIFSKEATFNPIKLHYNFRTAQLFQLVKTICCEIRPPLTLAEKPALSRLWCHESARLFGDCIIDSKESLNFHQHTIDIALTTFGVANEVFYPDSQVRQDRTQNWFANDLLFSYLGDSTTGVYRNGYHEVTEIPKLELLVERSMMTMNSSSSNTPVSMETVMCSDVIKRVLRVSRLLRMGRKAMLLLGGAGRKLVTITRLACFICKKISTIYHIPDEFARRNEMNDDSTDCRKWNETIRAAMLKSIRARDASLVLIVKDAYLNPEAYPYRIIDEFLGGHNLPPEVITYDDLDEEILTILREIAQRKLNPAQIPRRQSVTSPQQALSILRSKRSIMDYFFQCVRQKLQLVVNLSPNDTATQPTGWASILWRYPNILKSSDINYFGSWSATNLSTMAQICLNQSSMTTDIESILQLSKAAEQIYEITSRFLKDQQTKEARTDVIEPFVKHHQNDNEETAKTTPVWDSFVSPFVKLEPSMLTDHLGLFISHYDTLQRTISLNVARFKAGLEFIDQTAQILKTEQTQAQLLLPEMLEKTELRRKMSGSWEREKIAMDKVTRALELATTLVVTQRERLATVTQEYLDLIKDSRDAFDQIKCTLRVFHEACEEEEVIEENDKKDEAADTADKVDDVCTVDAERVARRRLRNQIRGFTSLGRIPSSIYQLSECLGVILGIEPVEGRDEMDPDEIIMNYWTNVAIQAKTAAFWKTLMTFDVRNVTEKMLSVLLPICRSPDFDKDLFASVHEIAGFLCEWVQKCTSFALDFVLALPKQAQLEREKELLKEAEKQVVKSKVEIYNQSTSAQQAGTQRDLSEQERQRADEKLHDTTSLLQLTSVAWKVLSSTREKWQQRYDAYIDFAEHWKGDLLLATAVIAYASCLNYSARLRLHRLWTDCVTPYSVLPSSQRRPLHEIFRTRDSELTKMELNGLPPNDESTLENAVIALNCYRLPLLIDPYGVASDWLKNHLETRKLTVVSGNNTSTNAGIWKEVEASVKRQTPLIILDICKDRLQGLHSFLSAKRRAVIDAINRDISIKRNGNGYRCWCYPPEDPTEEIDPLEAPVFEFSSDACSVFFVYTNSNATPEWMAKYLSQLTVIQIELTVPFVETQALQKLLESQGRLREITEIRTLQHEILVCDEQVYGLEEELLEFFSTEHVEGVYADNSKALRIIANRSAANTLQSTKSEAIAKIQIHWDSLSSYVAVARRCLDAVWAWREFNYLDHGGYSGTEDVFPLSRVWQLLVRAGETSNKNDSNLEEVMAYFTSYVQQCVIINLHDEDCLLFKFLLAFRIWQRRMEEQKPCTMGSDILGVSSEASPHNRLSTVIELLVRLLSLIGPTDGYDICRPTMKSLLELRPTGVKAKVWSAVCYLAEASGTLRQFIQTMQTVEGGQIAWKIMFEQETMSSSEWNVPVPIDAFIRLCIVVAIHPQRFICELEDFTERELQRIYSVPVTSTFCSLTVTETNTPSLPTLVAAAAYSAQTQAPDRQRDLFYTWQSFSSSKTPIVVFCPLTISFMDAVANVARRAGATMDTTDTIQLLRTDEAGFKKMVMSAMETGQWIVLPNLHSCSDRLEQLNRIYELVQDENIHSDFRLWISLLKKPVYAEFESMRVSQIAIRRELGTGFLSLKRALHHTFSILKHELDGLAFASTVAASHDVADTTSIFSEKEERCMKQLGVFHAVVSCRDHFPFAQWKANAEFGDTELCAAVRSMVTLHTEKETFANELRSASWDELTLRGVISNVYAATLKADQDKLLLECCTTFILNAWPTMPNESKLDTAEIVAHILIPEVVFVIEKLAAIPWMSTVSAIPHFWKSESLGPQLLKDSVAASGTTTEITTLWDPHYLRRERHEKMVAKLAVMAVNRGYQVNSTLMPANPRHTKGILPVLELLTSFKTSIESILVSSGSDCEYRKPIPALINHERLVLQQIRAVILTDIWRLDTVSIRDRVLDPATWQLFEELRRNRVPIRWLSLMRLPCSKANAPEYYTLDKFQILLLDRVHAFSSWTEPIDGPLKLPLDKFLSTKYVIEAVHQHFVRNHVGSALCYPDCLKIISLFEDSPKFTLPAKENVVYFTGLRAMGYLQLQIIDSRGNFRRGPICPEGVPVVLQVSSSCLPGTTTPPEMVTENTRRKPTEPNQPVDFLCPLFKALEAPHHSVRPEISILVVATVPIEQLVLSGASLQIQTSNLYK